MIGIGQYSPSAVRISAQTRSQSAEPWKPVSGAKPPLPIISKSAVWRSESVRESSVIVSLMRVSHQSFGEVDVATPDPGAAS